MAAFTQGCECVADAFASRFPWLFDVQDASNPVSPQKFSVVVNIWMDVVASVAQSIADAAGGGLSASVDPRCAVSPAASVAGGVDAADPQQDGVGINAPLVDPKPLSSNAHDRFYALKVPRRFKTDCRNVERLSRFTTTTQDFAQASSS